MKDDKSQAVERSNETITSKHERPQESYASTGRPDINEINKRNAEQDKQEQKASYKVAGMVILAIVLIVIAVYAFS